MVIIQLSGMSQWGLRASAVPIVVSTITPRMNHGNEMIKAQKRAR